LLSILCERAQDNDLIAYSYRSEPKLRAQNRTAAGVR